MRSMGITQEALLQPFGELHLYWSFADKIHQGLTPYVDFFPEYPPLALTLFSISNMFGEQWFTLMWYGMVLLATLGIMFLIKKLKGNQFIFLSCVLPLGGLFWDRFDIFSAFFSILSVYLAKKNNLWSIVALVMGIMIKIYPIVLLPVILLMFMMVSVKRALLATLLFVVTLVLFILPSYGFVSTLFKYHGNRGVQIESIKATPLLFKDSTVEWSHGTYEIQ